MRRVRGGYIKGGRKRPNSLIPLFQTRLRLNMFTEFWITYHFTSRAHLPPTTQLIELEHREHRLTDLEDVLEHGTSGVIACRVTH